MKSIIFCAILMLSLIACNSNTTENKYAEIESTQIDTNAMHIDSVQNNDTITIVDTTSICLPYPNDEFFSLKQNYFKIDDTTTNYAYDEVYWYLITNLDSLESRQIIEKQMVFDEYEMITKWSQRFSNEVTYSKHEYVESGVRTYLYTHCKNKVVFFQTISPIIEFQELDSTYYNPEMSWNKDSTRYEPISQEAGCYYEIKKDSVENYMLEWYCGC